MAGRTACWLAGLAAVGILAAGCGGGTDVGTEGRGDTATVRADSPTTETGEPEEGRSSASLTVAEFDVEGMTCGGCALATELAVRKLAGVESADADYDEATGEGRCTVEYDPTAVDADRIGRAIREAGFEPTLRERSDG